MDPIWVQGLIPALISTLSLGVLSYIARKVRVIASTPERIKNLEVQVSKIDSENRRAHGDLWNELRALARRY